MKNITVKKTITIEIDVDVYGTYHKGKDSDYFSPPEASEFEIKQVLWAGTDITGFLNDTDIDWYNLEEKCITEILERELDIN